MNYVEIKNIRIGEGMPKICVSVTGKTDAEILEQAKHLKETKVDVVEWRIDWYDDIFEIEKVVNVLSDLREVLSEIPLLVTFRTSVEGGEKSIEYKDYASLNKQIINTGNVDLVDIELFCGDEFVKDVIKTAHEKGVKVVISNHDFDKTPEHEEIISRLCKMQELGGDLLKIAVMPNSKKDVLTVLSATEEMHTKHAKQPLITMSMSKDGTISRLCGEVFGSALTFGAAKKASAPGQIGVDDLKTVLEIIHNC